MFSKRKNLYLWLIIIMTASCATPAVYDNGLGGPKAPAKQQREIVLIFERENNNLPVIGSPVSIDISQPIRLISPANGQGLTDASGSISILFEPEAKYDQNALADGDIVVDFPATLTVTLRADSSLWSWELDAQSSFARYKDPLYQGLDRDPDPGPLYFTLSIP